MEEVKQINTYASVINNKLLCNWLHQTGKLLLRNIAYVNFSLPPWSVHEEGIICRVL